MKNILTIVLFIGLVACQNATTDESYSATVNKISESEIKTANLKEETTNQILMGYFKIKDALTHTDAKSAAYAADELLFNFGEYKDELIQKLFHEVQLIAKSEDVDQQRIYFEGLSHNIYTLAKNTETEMELYQQYCPMAFENQGAYWISDEEKVYNPYFGDKMLRCGKTTEVIN